MENAKRKAVIDADFFIKSTHNDERAEIFLKMMEDLKIQPVMHRYVYEVELRKSKAVKQLVRQNQIEVYQTKEIVTDEKEYREYFLDAYEWFNRFELKEGEDIYTYHAEDESLGEIRSLYLARKKGYLYFLSDDGTARRFAKNMLSTSRHKIETLSLYEALLKCKDNGTEITFKQLNPIITEAFRTRQAKLKRIKEVYMNEKHTT